MKINVDFFAAGLVNFGWGMTKLAVSETMYLLLATYSMYIGIFVFTVFADFIYLLFYYLLF